MNTGCSDSDTSDEDYNPNKEKEEALSEEDSGEDSEELKNDSDNGISNNTKRGKKRKSNTRRGRKKVKNVQAEAMKEKTPEKEIPKPEDDKKRVDALWADFMKDTGFKPRAELIKDTKDAKELPKLESSKKKENPPKTKQEIKEDKVNEKVKITQVFDFAGEEVKVEKEVSVNSVEANTLHKTTSSAANSSKKPARGGGSGLSSVLSQIGKKTKINTLEKSKLDWEKFKKEQKIEEELQAYSKSKDGYLERQDFLQRADIRQFEIEKDIRNTLRNNRINNSSV